VTFDRRVSVGAATPPPPPPPRPDSSLLRRSIVAKVPIEAGVDAVIPPSSMIPYSSSLSDDSQSQAASFDIVVLPMETSTRPHDDESSTSIPTSYCHYNLQSPASDVPTSPGTSIPSSSLTSLGGGGYSEEMDESSSSSIDVLSPLPPSFIASPAAAAAPTPGSGLPSTPIRKASGSSTTGRWEIESPMSPPVPTTHLTLDDIPSRTHAASIHARTGSTVITPDTYRMPLPLVLPPTRQRGATWSPHLNQAAPSSIYSSIALSPSPPSFSVVSAQSAAKSSQSKGMRAAIAAYVKDNGNDDDDQDVNMLDTTTTASSAGAGGVSGAADDHSLTNESDQSRSATPLTHETDGGAAFRAATITPPTGLPYPSRPSVQISSTLGKKPPPPLPSTFSITVSSAIPSSSRGSSAPVTPIPPSTSSSSSLTAAATTTAPARPDKATVARLLGLSASLDLAAASNTPSTNARSTSTAIGRNNGNGNGSGIIHDTDDEWSAEAIDRAALGRLRSQSYAPSSARLMSSTPSTNLLSTTTTPPPPTAASVVRPPRPQLPAHVRAALSNGGYLATSPVIASRPSPPPPFSSSAVATMDR
jgi:hypothetical protein